MGTTQLIERVQIAVAAIAKRDVDSLPDAVLADHIGHLDGLIDQLEGQVTRLANTVLARAFVVSEVVAA